MTHPAESTHWYDKDGKPAYEVKAANGNMRPTTLRDARKFGYFPSVTTIIRLAAAPGLERWKQQQVLHAALTLPKIDGEAEDAYLDRIMQDAQEQGKKAAQRGTDIHAALEGGSIDGEYGLHVMGAAKALDDAFGGRVWTYEKSFAHPAGFGGKVDANCDIAIIDYKTTEKPLDGIKTWPEHAWQLSAYREGLQMPQARCAIVYVSVTEPGQAKVIELAEDELKQGWECFQALLAFHQAKTGYKP